MLDSEIEGKQRTIGKELLRILTFHKFPMLKMIIQSPTRSFKQAFILHQHLSQRRAKFNGQSRHLGKETVHPITGIVVEDISGKSAWSGARQPKNDIPQAGKQRNLSAVLSTKEWNPKQSPTFHGKCKKDVCRWIGYIKNILKFMQGTPEQEVNYVATYLRGAAHEWWEIYIRQEGYPRNWTQLSQALLKRFSSPIRAQKAQALVMSIKQGKRKMRDYTVEFQTLMDRLHSYDENWMDNIFICGLQPHIARSLSAAQPTTILEAINVAESIDNVLRASQKNRLTCSLRSKEGKNLKQSWRSSKKYGSIQDRNFARKSQCSGEIRKMHDIEVSNGQGSMQQNSIQGFDSQRMGSTVQHQNSSSH